ncbi:MAG: ABC transporter substrate-binding protein [Bdellovibrionota bacterium]|nr:MAG: ABC transporter substrate-binding protein [Bdellovibrionota bacterium]
MRFLNAIPILILLCNLSLAAAIADEPPRRIGVIASLSGFAAPYGQAVVNGAQVAKDELARQGIRVELFIEDDQSIPKNTATAYEKLRNLDRVQALVGGSWWVNSIVHSVERDGIPFISCETLYNKDFIRAGNYFSLAGDLREWIRVFEPLLREKRWKTGMMVRFVSGFADTLEEEWVKLFSQEGRKAIPALRYSDLEMTGAQTLATRAVAAQPDVIFVDAQPDSLATFIRELRKQGGAAISIFSHSAAEESLEQGLINQNEIVDRLFFLRRSSYDRAVLQAFSERGLSQPTLNGDLGYYATLLIAQALQSGRDPVAALKAGLTIHGTSFTFDDNNVSHTIRQEVYAVRPGGSERVHMKNP